MSDGEVFQELYLDATKSSLPVGARIGSVVILPGLGPFDPATGGIVGDDMESQLRAALPDGIHVVAQIVALPGTAARAIEIPGIHHNDWMSLGGRHGDLVTS